MELRRIVAADASSAREQAVQLFGQNTLIVSSRGLPKNRIEVIVAVESDQGSEGWTDSEPAAANDEATTSFRSLIERETLVDEPSEEYFEAASRESEQAEAARMAAAASSTPAGPGLHANSALGGYWSGTGTPPSPPNAQPVPPMAEQDPTHQLIEQLRAELRSVRRELDSLRRVQAASIDWVERITALGLPEPLARQIIARVGNALPADWDRAQLHEVFREALIERLARAPNAQVSLFFGEPVVSRGAAMVALARDQEETGGAGTATISVFGDAGKQRWAMLLQQAAQAGIQCLRSPDLATLVNLSSTFGGDSRSLLVDVGDPVALSAANGVSKPDAIPDDWQRLLVISSPLDRTTLDRIEREAWKGLVLTSWDNAAPDLAVFGRLLSSSLPLAAILDRDTNGEIRVQRSPDTLASYLAQCLLTRLQYDEFRGQQARSDELMTDPIPLDQEQHIHQPASFTI